MTRLLDPAGSFSRVGSPIQEAEAQSGDWNGDRIFRNLQSDSRGTYGVYGGAKLRSAYQPILSITHRRVVGYEALLRPHHDDGSQSDPSQFLAHSAARGEHLIVDRVSRAAHIANYGSAQRNAWLFLNMHPDVFNIGAGLGNFPVDVLERYGVPPHQVVLELLEHQSHDETAFQAAAMHYREHGFMLAIDDFGSGQSNFDRVWNLRPDFVKLDRSLVQRAEDSLVNQRMVRHMVALLHQAGSMVVAEGVETRRQALVMMEADVDFLQGFWLGRPQPVADEASAKAAVAQLEFAWEGFAKYDETLAREWQQSLLPFRNALKTAAQVFVASGDCEAASRAFFSISGGLRFFVLNRQGVMDESSIVNPARTRRISPSLAPLRPDLGGNWSRRAYFKQAIKNVGKAVVVGPHYSLTDGQGCYTAALAVEGRAGEVVLCGDFELLNERRPVEDAKRSHVGTRRVAACEFDPTLSVIGLASGMPRLRRV